MMNSWLIFNLKEDKVEYCDVIDLNDIADFIDVSKEALSAC